MPRTRPRRTDARPDCAARRLHSRVEALEARSLFNSTLPLQVVAATGAPVPGVPGPFTFAGELASPVVNDAGHVAFTAHFTGPGVSSDNDSAVFAGPADAPALVAREGDPVPGLDGPAFYDDATAVRNLLLDDAGHVAFTAQLRGPDITTQQWALVAGDATSPAAVARTSGPAPGGSAGYAYGGSFDTVRLTDDGRLWFASAANEPGSDTGYAIFSARLGAEPVRRVVGTGDPAPGAPGLPELRFVYTGPRIGAVGPDDRLLSGADVRGTDGSDPYPHGLFYAGTRQALAPVPDLVWRKPVPSLDPSLKYEFFTDPLTVNANGQAPLVAYFLTPTFGELKQALLLLDGTAVRPLIAPGDPGPLPGTRFAPNNGATAATIDNAGRITFFGRLEGATPQDAVNGIFTGTEDHWRLVARVGQPAPGAGDGINLSELGAPVTDDAGRLAFEALLSGPGVTGLNNKALYATDAAGALVPVARTGDAIDLGGGRTRLVRDITWSAPGPFRFGTITNGTDGNVSQFNDAGRFVFHVTTEDGEAVVAADVGGRPRTAVVARHLFYNNSAFDGYDPAPGTSDDEAVDPRPALLPGQAGSSAHVSNYDKGINGIVLDIAALPAGATPTADDFDFKTDVGAAPTPASVTVRRGAGAGGSDRVTLTWPDRAVRNTWLRVTVKATANTGLAAPDVFAFGNLVGKTASAATPPRVGPADLAAVRRALFSQAPVSSPVDFDRDGRVTATDFAIARANYGRTLSPFSPPPTAPPSAASAPQPIRPPAAPPPRQLFGQPPLL